MKKVILLVFFMPYLAFGQIVENFEPGNANNWIQSSPGRWNVDSVTAISGKYSLHHIFDNPDAGTDKTGIPIKNLHPSLGTVRWSFLVRHGYDPSSSNNWSVFLLSNADPTIMSPDGGTNGFAVGVNLTGYDDTLRLWKVKGSALTAIVNCHLNWQTDIGITTAAKIIVERSQEGIWMVSVYRLNGNLIRTSTGNDSELFATPWFGIYYRYSSTRDRLLWFDDLKIEGVFFIDNEAPVISECKVSGKKSLEITLNEEPLVELMVPDNFSLSADEFRAVSVVKIKALTYRVEFSDPFINKTVNKLLINNLCDNSGNCTRNIILPFPVVWAEPGDVIISEIMADPLPEVSLPGKEYLELTNRTEFSFNLKNWRFSSEPQYSPFPETFIQPSGILIICSSQDTSLFKKFGKVIGLKQFPSLTDDGKIICLSDSSGSMIHGVEYSSAWCRDELKSGGGWSLEMIDTHYPFNTEGNWTVSLSKKGGTPGMVNSVAGENKDNSFYGVKNVFPEDSVNIIVKFSEPVFNLQEKYVTFRIGGKEIKDLYPIDPLFRVFSVKVQEPLKTGEVYTLDITGDIRDFAGNPINKREKIFGLPEQCAPGDLLFNELLFNPLPGDQDYIEFFNQSSKVIDASRLQLVSVSDATGDTSQTYLISVEKRCIMPGSYYAITTDKTKITERYYSSDPEFLFETGSLPAMNDDKGHLVLYNRELDKIDQVMYNEKMHFSLLSTDEGVALEKTGTRNKSEEAMNWHSASESCGWGTPGAQNSVMTEFPASSDKVVFSSTKITPDNDGFEDFLEIKLSLNGNGNVVSVTVFDETGNYVKKIADNLFAGAGATLTWDGTAADGKLVGTGIYIVFITLYDDTGKTEKWKKVCTVIRK